MVDTQCFFSERAKLMQGSDIRAAFKLAENQEIISFAGGFPSDEFFLAGEVQSIVSELLATSPGMALQYGPTEGIARLRSQIATSMQGKGIDISPEEVLITAGSQQALDLIGRMLINPGDLVVMENPAYIGAVGALNTYQPWIEGISIDEDGISIDVLAGMLEKWAKLGRRPKLLYTVPTFHNPTGVTLADERRRRLIELAEEYNFLIVEDNPYEEIAFDSQPVPAIKTLDTGGRVIYLGSFSKIFSPGLRVGWIAATKEIIERLGVAKQSMDLCGSTFNQLIVSLALERDLLADQIPLLRSGYRQRRDAMLKALENWAPEGVSWTKPKGGFFVWLLVPEGVNTNVLLKRAIENKVAYVCGEGFHLDGKGQNTIRLAYSQNGVKEIEEGIWRLCKVIKEEAHTHSIRKVCIG